MPKTDTKKDCYFGIISNISAVLLVISIFILIFFPNIQNFLIQLAENHLGKKISDTYWFERLNRDLIFIILFILSVFSFSSYKNLGKEVFLGRINSAQDFFCTHDRFLYTILFSIICLLGIRENITNNLSLIWNIDSAGQYFPAFVYTGKYLQNLFGNIVHGIFSLPSYDLSIGMGEDIISSLNYYGFGNPLNILSVFVNNSNAEFLFSLTYFLKLYISGLAFIFYCRKMKIQKPFSVLGAVFYVFSGFAVTGAMKYSEWVNPMIYLPLILCGAEFIFRGKKNYLLTISVFFAAITGFYFLYMTSIFLAVYAIVRLSMIHGADVKKISFSCLKCLLFYILGIMLASPILFSSLGGFLGSERNSLGFMNAVFDMKTWILDSSFPMLSKFSDFFSGDEPIVKLASIIEVFALIFLFFKRKNTKSHMVMKISVLIILILIQIPFTGYIFNSFGETNLRWIFIVHFIFAFISVYILQDLEEIKISFNDNENFQVIKKHFFTFIAVISVFTCGNNFSSAISEIGDFAKKTETEKLTSSPFRDFGIEGKDLFRVSNEPLLANGRPENMAMINNYNGLNYWFSIINSNAQDFVDEVYSEKQDWRSFGMNGNSTYETVCGVKYFMSPSEDNSRNYIFLASKDFLGTKWNLFENPDFFGMAYKIGSEKEKIFNESNGNFEEYLKSLIKFINKKGLGINLSYDKNYDSFSADFSTEENNSELTVLIPFSRNWTAFVDGTEAECKKTDKMFMSVSIKDSGNHSVRFVYRNYLFRYGLILSAIGILFIATEIILRKKFQR